MLKKVPKSYNFNSMGGWLVLNVCIGEMCIYVAFFVERVVISVKGGQEDTSVYFTCNWRFLTQVSWVCKVLIYISRTVSVERILLCYALLVVVHCRLSYTYTS